jgi:hypothetical protein
MGDGSAATAEPAESPSPLQPSKGPRSPSEPDHEVTAKLARREAQRREARLLLKERVQNRTATLMSELRNQLLFEIHNTLDYEGGSKILKDILQASLDPSLLRKLDTDIDSEVFKLTQRLKGEFRKEEGLESLLPSTSTLVEELKSYRDQIVRTHLLDQVEVYALPQLAQVFPEGGTSPEQLKRGIARYWKACQIAIDRFSKTAEMSLLIGSREGLRVAPSVIRERLIAAPYRNGYRALGARLADEYTKVAQLQMAKGVRLEKLRPSIDRQVVRSGTARALGSAEEPGGALS